jgi:predicted RND superfamily exporter protein
LAAKKGRRGRRAPTQPSVASGGGKPPVAQSQVQEAPAHRQADAPFRRAPWGALRRPAQLLLAQPLVPLLVAALLSAGLGFGVTRLQTDASAGLLMDTGSAAYEDQARFADVFGADPVVIMAEPAKGQQLLTPAHVVGLAQLEGQLAKARGVRRVYGPGTLVNTFAGEVTRRALDLCGAEGQRAQEKAQADAKAAGKSDADQAQAGSAAFDAAVRSCAQGLAARYPDLSAPALNNPGFYGELLLEPNGSARPYWRAVLPDPGHALITVRMDRNASLSDVEHVMRIARTATSGAQTEQVTTNAGQQVSVATTAGNLSGLRFTVTGTPALAAELASSVQQALVLLLPLALALMLLISALVLRVSFRWLAVPLAAVAGLWTAGAAGLAGLPLTPATLAVLPVVLGLTTDYALQLANRLAEERAADEATPEGERLRRAASAILPATAIAAGATAAGLLAFAVSSVPLVRQFGFFLALGVACSWLAGLLVGLPALRLLLRFLPGRRPARAPSWGPLAGLGRLPRWLAAVLTVLGLAGWAALPFIRIETDPSRLMPAGSPALAQAGHVAGATGEAGELDLVVTGPDVTSPRVVAWMGVTERRLMGPDLKPVSTLPDFLLAFNRGTPPDAATTKRILDGLPAYFTQAVVSQDHHVAVLTFVESRVTSVDQDRALVARAERAAAGAPPGYRAYPAGLSALASSALDGISRDQVWLNVLAVALVVAVLLAAYRRPLPALLAVLPTVMATGWLTALMLGATRVAGLEVTPITVLGAGVVVAFATEFGVLWLSRFRAERAAGGSPEQASEVASRRLGPAIVAAAAALAAGFAALAASQVPMVRDFGLWCAGDLALATAAVLLLLPPAARAWLR